MIVSLIFLVFLFVLIVLRNVGQMFWRRPLNCNLSDVCLTNRLVKWASERKTTETKCQIIECLLSLSPIQFIYICVFLWLDSSFPFFQLFRSIQSLSHVWLFETPWTAAHQASLSITNSRSLPKLMSIESVMPSNHLICCHLHFLPPSIFPSIRVFSNESALCVRCPKCWSFSFNISPSNEHSGLISFRMDWLDLLEVQGTLKSLPNTMVQKHQFFRAQLFFIVQLSHSYMTTGKTIDLTRWTFVG